MERNQLLQHLAQAERHITQMQRYILRQENVIRKLKLREAPTDIAESMLTAMKDSLDAFERHRKSLREALRTRP
jgi:hypothetical protein